MERAEARHLLRRFGFGASTNEVETLSRLSTGDAVRRVLDFSPTDGGVPVHPFEFLWDKDNQFQNQVGRVAAWWVLRMVLSDRPAVDKLALFWHDHFATSGSKVTNGLLMLHQLRTLQSKGGGRFRDVLGAMATDPAMLVWLDGQTSIKGKPNENFARELLELFTLGLGHYTEQDVQEASRAFTGWSLRSTALGGNQPGRIAQLVQAAREDEPLVYSSYTAGLADAGPKTILGERRNFDWSGVLDLTADHAETTAHLCRKLWEYYVYPDPQPKVVDRVAKEWKRSQGDVTAVLHWMATSDEFWSAQARRAVVKCPVDYVVGLVRQLDIGNVVLAARDKAATPETPLAQPVRNVANALLQSLNKMGMVPLFPPDVAGWNWGTAWITTATVIERLRFAENLAARPETAGASIVRYLSAAGATGDTQSAAEGLLDMFDADADKETVSILTGVLDRRGGKGVLADPAKGLPAFRECLRLMGAAPRFQFL